MADDPDARAAQLLAEVGWVRRLAAQLVGGDGDDVAQETWLTAAREAPALDRPLRPWLATVVRTLAHTRRRGEARRRAREQAAPPAAETATPESLLARAELLRLVGELVAALEEPYRSTVLLRYYEGLTSQQIAARQGVSDGTVRWRLKQGLDELRRALDRRVDGGRRAWMMTLGATAAGRAAAGKAAGALVAKALVALALLGAGGAAVVRERAASRRAAALPAIVGSDGPRAPASPVAAPLPPGSGAAAAPGGDALGQAQQAYVGGRYALALELAARARAQNPQKAWRVIGASSCFLADGAGARQAWQHVDARGRSFIEYVCARNHVALPPTLGGRRVF